MVAHLNDNTLFEAYGKNDFVNTITAFNQKLYKDPVTGVYNRRYYEEQLNGLIHQHAIAMLDVDDFKIVNDTYGHQIGDLSLCCIARKIQSFMHEQDVVIRYGGDEFMILCQDISEDDFALRLHEIREAIYTMQIKDQADLHLSVSIGGIYHTETAVDAVKEADCMLYKAKAKKNDVEIKK